MVFDKVCEIIASQFQLDAGALKAETRLVEDLNADSANVMVLIMDLEDQFQMEVEDEVILRLKTIGDIVAYIEAHQ